MADGEKCWPSFLFSQAAVILIDPPGGKKGGETWGTERGCKVNSCIKLGFLRAHAWKKSVTKLKPDRLA